MKRTLTVLLVLLNAAGFLISLAIHILALIDCVPPVGMAIFAPLFGLVITALPVFALQATLGNQPYKLTPSWLRFVMGGLVCYLALHIFIGILNPPQGNDLTNPIGVRLLSAIWLPMYFALVSRCLFILSKYLPAMNEQTSALG